ncbi:MAG: hypothetical protein WC829_12460 [Hyphomicrobium sp.]|jgi:hypothetical protein
MRWLPVAVLRYPRNPLQQIGMRFGVWRPNTMSSILAAAALAIGPLRLRSGTLFVTSG